MMAHEEKNEIKCVTYIMKHNKTCLVAAGEKILYLFETTGRI